MAIYCWSSSIIIQIIEGPPVYRLLLYQVCLLRTHRMNLLLFLFSYSTDFGTKNWSVLTAVNIVNMEQECYSILNCCYEKPKHCVSDLASLGTAADSPNYCYLLSRFAYWSHLSSDCLLFCSLQVKFSFDGRLADVV
jgi:hypothetical protein